MRDENNAGPISDAIRNAKPAVFPDLEEIQARLDAKSKANVAHTPRQQGPWIVCTSCEIRHTLGWVGPTRSLVGIDEEGGWILKDRF